MKPINTKIQLTIAAVAAITTSVVLMATNASSGKHEEDTAAVSVSTTEETSPAVLVDGYLIRNKTVANEILTTGTVLAKQEVKLVSEVARKVVGIYSREGSMVRKGSLLFKLDDADLQAKKKKLLLQEKLAQIEENRFRELLTSEAVNQQEYDQVSTHLKVLQAELQALEVEIAKTEIRAPFNGKIGLNQVDVGAYVTPATPLSYLEDVSQVKIIFTVPEKYVTDVKEGQEVEFTTENNIQSFHGKIVATESKTDLNTRSLLVKAISNNREGQLVPGTSARVSIKLKSNENGKLIPTEALIPTPDGYEVFSFKNGQASRFSVKTGIRTKSAVQILEGLSVGDTVITSNMLRLAPGMPVKLASIKN